MAFMGQISTHSCLPDGPPSSSQKGVFLHRSHFWACLSSKFHCTRDGVKGHASTQRSQPMHLPSSTRRTPVSGSACMAPTGQASTQEG